MLYFDHNATTPLDPRVLEAMLPYLQQFYGNASALYRLGRASRSALETARAQVARLVGVQPEQVIFTSGGTEANNLALQQIHYNGHLVVSAIEHPSIMVPALRWKSQGNPLSIIDVGADGLLTPDAFEHIALQKGDLLSVQLANNETGVIQSVVQTAERFHAKQVILHTDAVQALGKIAVDFNRLGVHLMSLSSHKIYGPKGCGALIVKTGFAVQSLIEGGGQEYGLRAGTENIAAIVGFGKAAELAADELQLRQQHLLSLRTQLEQGLKTIPGVVIFAEHTERLPNTVFWGLDKTDGEMLLMQLDRKGIAVASGSACKSGDSARNTSLSAMGVASELANSAIRVSLGQQNTPTDIVQFIDTVKVLVTQSFNL